MKILNSIRKFQRWIPCPLGRHQVCYCPSPSGEQ